MFSVANLSYFSTNLSLQRVRYTEYSWLHIEDTVPGYILMMMIREGGEDDGNTPTERAGLGDGRARVPQGKKKEQSSGQKSNVNQLNQARP